MRNSRLLFLGDSMMIEIFTSMACALYTYFPKNDLITKVQNIRLSDCYSPACGNNSLLVAMINNNNNNHNNNNGSNDNIDGNNTHSSNTHSNNTHSNNSLSHHNNNSSYYNRSSSNGSSNSNNSNTNNSNNSLFSSSVKYQHWEKAFLYIKSMNLTLMKHSIAKYQINSTLLLIDHYITNYQLSRQDSIIFNIGLHYNTPTEYANDLLHFRMTLNHYYTQKTKEEKKNLPIIYFLETWPRHFPPPLLSPPTEQPTSSPTISPTLSPTISPTIQRNMSNNNNSENYIARTVTPNATIATTTTTASTSAATLITSTPTTSPTSSPTSSTMTVVLPHNGYYHYEVNNYIDRDNINASIHYSQCQAITADRATWHVNDYRNRLLHSIFSANNNSNNRSKRIMSSTEYPVHIIAIADDLYDRAIQGAHVEHSARQDSSNGPSALDCTHYCFPSAIFRHLLDIISAELQKWHPAAAKPP